MTNRVRGLAVAWQANKQPNTYRQQLQVTPQAIIHNSGHWWLTDNPRQQSPINKTTNRGRKLVVGLTVARLENIQPLTALITRLELWVVEICPGFPFIERANGVTCTLWIDDRLKKEFCRVASLIFRCCCCYDQVLYDASEHCIFSHSSSHMSRCSWIFSSKQQQQTEHVVT